MLRTIDQPSSPLETQGSKSQPCPGDEEPLRAEPFSLERLEEHARQIAAAHRDVVALRHHRPLLVRFEDNSRLLGLAYQTIARAVQQGEAITAEGEWLLEKFHVVEEQLGEIREDLHRPYYRQLPKLHSEPLAGR